MISKTVSILATLAESFSASVVINTQAQTYSIVCPIGRRWCATETDTVSVSFDADAKSKVVKELRALLNCGTEPREKFDPIQIDTGDWLTIATAANFKNISRQAVYKWAKRNQEKTVEIDGVLFVHRSYCENK